MRGRTARRRVGVWVIGAIAMFALPSATALASGSASTASLPRTYGPARDWGGTQIRALDCPAPPAPVPAGCQPAANGSGGASASTSSTPAPAVNNATTSSVPADQILSNETTLSQWAYVHRIANIYRQPSTHSRRITKLHWYTEDGFNEIYLLLRAHWNSPRTEWIKIRVPGRPNGRTGWVQRGALGRFHVTHDEVVVNRRQMRLYYYSNGQRIWSAPVGIGARSMPTPSGHFWIRERFVITNRSNGYYPYAFGTADYSTLTDWPGGGVVGIHGPFGAPASAIPGRISHGCIRLRISDDFWLGRHLKLGTPLRVI